MIRHRRRADQIDTPPAPTNAKRYADPVAVDDLSFEVPAGRVTGFLGPNGAGTSTTMRAVVGLDRPTSGAVRINGHRYTDNRAR